MCSKYEFEGIFFDPFEPVHWFVLQKIRLHYVIISNYTSNASVCHMLSRFLSFTGIIADIHTILYSIITHQSI
jgi:hypothetical protein